MIQSRCNYKDNVHSNHHRNLKLETDRLH